MFYRERDKVTNLQIGVHLTELSLGTDFAVKCSERRRKSNAVKDMIYVKIFQSNALQKAAVTMSSLYWSLVC